MNMQATAYLSITETADELSIARQNVWAQIKAGAIKAMKIGEIYAIPQQEVRRVRKERISTLRSRLNELESKQRADR